jgi:ribosome-interacting GTPase 1
MPANLPPPYFEAERSYKKAKTPSEKIIALETMLAIMPKHKGTDKLRADLRKRLSQLRDESMRKTGGKRSQAFDIERTGAGQVVLVGFPNVGKSQLLGALTQAKPEVGAYPYTTRLPLPGMMHYENIQIQLIDIPSLFDESAKAWLTNVIRNADALLLVVDLADDPQTQAELLLEELEHYKVRLPGSPGAGEIGFVEKKMMVVGNKADTKDGSSSFHRLKEDFLHLNPLAVSAKEGRNVKSLAREVFDLLGIIRVYTKTPGKDPDLKNPVILGQGSSVLDFASQIHKDFARKLRYARIWGSGKYKGQRVQREHILGDGDVIELHI